MLLGGVLCGSCRDGEMAHVKSHHRPPNQGAVGGREAGESCGLVSVHNNRPHILRCCLVSLRGHMCEAPHSHSCVMRAGCPADAEMLEAGRHIR